MYKRFFNKCEICCFIQGACSEQFQTFLNEGVVNIICYIILSIIQNDILEVTISGNFNTKSTFCD
jgi:hypothetical protein